MTLGCEAFAVGVDDPAEVYGDLRGDRVPFGLDLEWETDGGGLPVDRHHPLRGALHASTARSSWATRRSTSTASASATTAGACATGGASGGCWTAGWLDDGTRFHTTRVRVPGLEAFAPGLRAAAGRHRSSRSTSCTAEEELDDHGFPTRGLARVRRRSTWPSSRWRSRRCTWSTTTAPGPGIARFPRALCRFDDQPTAARASAGPSGTSPTLI